MANDKAKVDEKINMHDVAADWFFQQYYHSETRPYHTLYHDYTKTLMNLAGADGVLADKERQWILGNLAAKGGDEKMYNFFKTYMPSKEDLEKIIKEKPGFTEVVSRSTIFDAFIAASADNELHKDERDAIYRLGHTMGLEDTLLQQIEDMAAREKSHRLQVLNLVFPQGLQHACDTAIVDYKNN
ncbi:hypothetical protein I4U23_031305 [Adineta vaga]|nr:hypothetical protein I4U23_031305 [Adineta vaga]